MTNLPSNIGDLSKPATVLVEKICNAVGVIYEPTRIRREAKARADAEIIAALGRQDLREIEARAAARLMYQETRRQENIEAIAGQAIDQLPDDAKVDGLEEDWIANFFKHCDTVSDREMQSLWARLLAGEASTPGAFSKRTIAVIAMLDKRDAELFTTFCQFVWHIEKQPIPIIDPVDAEIYARHDINFVTLQHLASLGLISFDPLAGYTHVTYFKYATAFYFDRRWAIEYPEDTNNRLPVGSALLTSVGTELFKLCGAGPNDEFFSYVMNKWQSQRGLKLKPILGA